MLDTLIQAAIVIVLLLVFFILTNFFADLKTLFDFQVIEALPKWSIALLIIALYLVRVGYFIFFETIWSGQSPGKRALRIRAVKENGYPISFQEAMIRNLLRIVDILPGLYGVGFISAFFSAKEKRVGDYVAGTIVVKEKIQELPSPQEPKLPSLEKSLLDFGPSITRMSKKEYEVISRFLQRRFELDPASRLRLARKIALPLIEKLEVSQPLNMSYEIFLLHLSQAYEKNAKFI